MTLTTRYLCPLDCGWHHDPRALPDLADLSGNSIEDIIHSGIERQAQAEETVIREHLETHSLVEWVTEVARLQRELGAAVAKGSTTPVTADDFPWWNRPGVLQVEEMHLPPGPRLVGIVMDQGDVVEAGGSDDSCRVVEVDGGPVRVHGGEMDAQSTEYLGEVVAAAKRAMAEMPPGPNEFDCPTCGAVPGQLCRRESGMGGRAPHDERRELARQAAEVSMWALRITVSAPTPADAERWTRGIRDMVTAEFGDSMRLSFDAGPVLRTPATDTARPMLRPGSYPKAAGDATAASDMCPRCKGDNSDAWALCAACEDPR